jgi:hypothetical protein
MSVQQLGTGNVASFRTATGATAMFVNAAGNVGLGTTIPQYPLHVVSSGTAVYLSNTALQTTLNAQIGRINFGNGGSDASIASCVNVGGANNNTDLRFYTSADYANQNIERMRIDRNGNVGIGTVNPGTTLDVNGSMNALNYAQSTFTNQGLVTITQTSASGTSMLTGATGSTWTAYAYSNQGFKYGAFCSARANQTNTLHMIGLATSQVNGNMTFTFAGISYAWYFNVGTLQIYESGTQIASYGTYTTSTVVSITFDGTNIIYWKDGVSQRTVARSVGVPLYFGYAGLTAGASVNSVQFDAFGSTTYAGRNIVATTGSFSGTFYSPGSVVQVNSFTYSNNATLYSPITSNPGLATAVQVSITPKFTTSLLVVQVNIAIQALNGNNNSATVSVARDGTFPSVTGGYGGGFSLFYLNGTNNICTIFPWSYTWTASSTNSTTFVVYVGTLSSASQQVYVNSTGFSTITVTEVAQ